MAAAPSAKETELRQRLESALLSKDLRTISDTTKRLVRYIVSPDSSNSAAYYAAIQLWTQVEGEIGDIKHGVDLNSSHDSKDKITYRTLKESEAIASLVKELSKAINGSSCHMALSVFLGRIYVEVGQYEKGLQELSKTSTSTLLKYTVTADTIEQGTTAEKYWGLQLCLYKGIALEFLASSSSSSASTKKALECYEEAENFMQSFKVNHIVTSVLFMPTLEQLYYRSGLLKARFNKTKDASLTFRKYLKFFYDRRSNDLVTSKTRLKVILECYLNILEKSLTDAEFESILAEDNDYTASDSVTTLIPKSIAEETVLCTLLFCQIEQRAIQTKDDNESQWVKCVITAKKRLAVHSIYSPIVALTKDLFNLMAVDVRIYRDLMLALIGDGMYSEAFLAGRSYFSMKGNDLFVRLLTGRIAALHFEDYPLALEYLGWFEEHWGKDEIESVKDSWLLKGSILNILGYVYGEMSRTDPRQKLKYRSAAITHLNKAIELNRSDSTSLFLLAYYLADDRKIDESIVAITKSLAVEPMNKEGWHLLALLRSAKQDHELTLKTCEYIFTEFGITDNLNVALTQIETMWWKGRPDDALSILNELFASRGYTAGKVMFDDIKTMDLTLKGKVFLWDEDFKNKPDTSAIDALISLWLQSATVFKEMKKWEDAKRSVDEAAKLDESNADIFFHYGHVNEMQGKNKEALESYQNAVILDEDHFESLLGLSRLYLANGNPDLCYYFLQLAEILEPHDAEVWVLKSKLAQARKRTELAIEHAGKAMTAVHVQPVRPFSVIPRKQIFSL